MTNWFFDPVGGSYYPSQKSVLAFLPEGRRVTFSGPSPDAGQTRPELDDVRALWRELADVPISDSECIDQQFLHFPAGTFREDIWRWFEKECPAFIVGQEMSGQGRDLPRERNS